MLEMLGSCLIQALTPPQIIFMFMGVLFGLVMGFIPGIGGTFVLVMLLPFVFNMSTEAAIAFLVSAHAVVVTGGSISAILFGVPGSPVNAATVFDGYAMSKNGQAGRAIGAALGASATGGVIGALILLVLIPVIRPLVMSFGPPELLFLALLGVSLIALLASNNPLKGIIAGLLGVILSLAGQDWVTGAMRYTFGSVYLWDGLKLLPVLLGLFAVAEMVELSIKGGKIAETTDVKIEDSPITGFFDVIKYRWLVFRCSAIGAVIGIIPGLGGDVANFLAYGHASQSCDAKKMGTGMVQGVIAPESANNAKEGGAFVPTIAFGIPGSSGMAILLGALTIIGLTPGPEMLGSQVSSTYLIIVMLVISNIIGAAIVVPFVKQLSSITRLNVYYLVPVILVVSVIGAFNATRNFGDIIVLVVFGLVGYEMKKLGYSRPSFILGFILGVIIERNMWLSFNAFGLNMFGRPIVIALMIVLAVTFLSPIVKSLRKRSVAG